jgi:hypothetical protein
LVGLVKNSLDDSLSKSMGRNVYEASRNNRATRGALFDNNNAVSKFLPPEDGIESNRQVQVEKILPTLTSKATSTAQFKSVLDSMRGSRDYFLKSGDPIAGKQVSDKVRDAYQALREHFGANSLKAGQMQGGGWNQAKFAQYLQDNEGKMAQVFTPHEMDRWTDLNRAGNLLKMDRSYPGAHAQAVNANALREKVGNLAETGAHIVGAHGGPALMAASELGGLPHKIGNFVKGNPEAKALKDFEAKHITNLANTKPGGGGASIPLPGMKGGFETVKQPKKGI